MRGQGLGVFERAAGRDADRAEHVAAELDLKPASAVRGESSGSVDAVRGLCVKLVQFGRIPGTAVKHRQHRDAAIGGGRGDRKKSSVRRQRFCGARCSLLL